MSQLERAAKLHEQGVLSDQEFADLKQRILHGNPPPLPPESSPPSPATPPHDENESGPQPQKRGTDGRISFLLITATAAFLAGARSAGSPAGTRIGRSGLPVQQVASDPKAIYPDQQVTSNLLVAPPIQPSQGRVVWEPDTPGSQTGTLRGTLHTGVDAGTSLGPGQLLISKNGEYLDIPVTKNGNDYVWEVPNAKSGDEIQIWQEVYFRSLKKPRDQPTVTFKGTVHPQQYPPPDAIKVTPETRTRSITAIRIRMLNMVVMDGTQRTRSGTRISFRRAGQRTISLGPR
nr:SHOCT domain-containing protein [Nocardia sp. XZ_19_369]